MPCAAIAKSTTIILLLLVPQYVTVLAFTTPHYHKQQPTSSILLRATTSYLQSLSTSTSTTTSPSATTEQRHQQQQQQRASQNHPWDQKTIPTFHQLNPNYPHLHLTHHNPDVYTVKNFLTNDECDRLITKLQRAGPGDEDPLRPSHVRNPATGVIELDPRRTSSNANVPRAEVPTIVRKITNLTRCDDNQLEMLQVLRYERGQFYKPHCDGFDGPTCSCGFENSNRLVTLFVYLNSVSRGGETTFPLMNLSIKPEKGTAVIHFPADTDLNFDPRTIHESWDVEGEDDVKYLLVTWVWAHALADSRYNEEMITRLTNDII